MRVYNNIGERGGVVQFVRSVFMLNNVMIKYLFIFGILFGLLTEALSQSGFRRAFRIRNSPESSETLKRMLSMPYGEHTRYMFRDSQEERRELEESRPLCEEERKSLNIRELIYTSASNFLQSGNNNDLRKYNLIPRKVDVIKCVSKQSEEQPTAVCKPENCKERKVDVEVFGRLKNETGNFWEYVGTLSAVPVACECFVRWKPEKCQRSYNLFSEV